MSGYALLQECYFTDEDKHAWMDAMSYLLENYSEFPADMDMNIQHKPEFRNFRFMRAPGGGVMFANCIVPGITADDFNQFKTIN